MRSVVTAACVLLLSGCAGGTDAALTGQDAKNKLGVKDRALSQLAATQVTAITQRAVEWSAANGGSMAGFAADLQATQPSVASSAKVLTDTSVAVSIGTGQCLIATLPTGRPTTAAC
jgi:spore germination cell wall hydrolase CwlJ-like protein